MTQNGNMRSERKQKNNRLIGSVYIILSAFLFGLMPLMTRTIFAHGGNAYTSAFFRFSMGAVFLWAVIRFGNKDRVRVEKAQLISVAGLSCFYALMLGLLYSSYAFISSGLATTLHFTYPAAVILLQLILFRSRPSGRELLCLLLAVGGVFLMNLNSGGTNFKGMLLAVMSGVAYAFYIALYGRSCTKSLSAPVLSFWISVFAALELGIFITATGNWQLPADAVGWGMTVLLAFSMNVLALVFFQKGLKICGGVAASLLSTFEPITSLFVGFLVYHEQLGVSSIIAVICILCSVVILLAGPPSES